MKIAIASGKGGTGKTFVSTNLFWVAQQTGSPVTLVDCDAEAPNVREFISGGESYSQTVFQHIPVIDTERCTYCGLCFEYCNYGSIIFLSENRFIHVVEDLCHDCGACSVACKLGAITEKEKALGTVRTMSYNSHAEIIEACTEIGIYSPVTVIKKAITTADEKFLTLLDSPPGISCPFITTVRHADFVVLVTEPTPFGLHDLKLSIKTLQEINKPFGVVINRAGLGNNELNYWLCQKNIPLLMEIPFDREIARIYSEGLLATKEYPVYRTLFEDLLKSVKKMMS